MERREGGVWSRAGRAGAGGDPRACVQAMPRRWSPSWLVLPASRWWSRLRECPWARGAASPARGGDGVCPLSALPQLRGRWGGTRSRRRRPGSLDSGIGQMEFWEAAGLPSRPGALWHGALPSIASPCALSGSVVTGLAGVAPGWHRGGTGDLRVTPCHVQGVSGDPRWQRWLGHTEDGGTWLWAEPISEDVLCCKPRNFHTFLVFLVFGWFCGFFFFGRVMM